MANSNLSLTLKYSLCLVSRAGFLISFLVLVNLSDGSRGWLADTNKNNFQGCKHTVRENLKLCLESVI